MSKSEKAIIFKVVLLLYFCALVNKTTVSTCLPLYKPMHEIIFSIIGGLKAGINFKPLTINHICYLLFVQRSFALFINFVIILTLSLFLQ